jgi:phosphoglycerate dehydrogenase-like enzyme
MTAKNVREPVTVLIASWLDPQQAERIASAEPHRIDVIYEPDLLPKPRYVADHHGPRLPLSSAELDRWASLLARAEVSFEFDWDRPSDMLQRAPKLRWVQSTSSGIGPLLIRLGIAGSPLVVTNAAGLHAQPLAEFVIMSAIYFAKDMPLVAQWQSKHHWERYCANEVAGSRMLLIGLGKVGARIAALSAAIGIEVIGHRRTTHAGAPPGVSRLVTSDEIDAELPNADLVVLAAPDAPETRNILDRRRLSLLPGRAVIINVGRGNLIDEAALTEMLATGRLRGAALDVFAKEPLDPASPLWDMPNVIVSPHSASTVFQENDRLVDLFIENMGRYLDGEPLVNVFDHSRLVPSTATAS